jgi:hypothetical protein
MKDNDDIVTRLSKYMFLLIIICSLLYGWFFEITPNKDRIDKEIITYGLKVMETGPQK